MWCSGSGVVFNCMDSWSLLSSSLLSVNASENSNGFSSLASQLPCLEVAYICLG